MIYSKFSLNNFRCFKTRQFLVFAIPDGEKTGSGLTYIVGANNSGKTSVLEAMQFKQNDLLNVADQSNTAQVSKFEYYDENGNMDRGLQNTPGHYLLKTLDEHNANQDTLPYFIPSRRYWQSRMQNTGMSNYALLVERSHVSRLRSTSEYNSDLDVAGLLKGIESDPEQYAKIVEIMRLIIPDFGGYASAYNDYEYIECKSGNDKYKSSYSGEGISSLLRIVVTVITAQDRPIVIDEPELSLHPLAKRRLAEWLGELSRTRQIIIATHDPYFVSWDYICNGAKVNRLVKDCDNATTIHYLSNIKKYETFVQTGHNWQKPQMMDLLSKEIFFCDNILFLEGQQDVGLLRSHSLIDERTINIFDYGIGGIPFAGASLALAKDLGLRRVAIILDNGEQETIIANKLRSDYPEYKIIQWDKEDIRDKKDEAGEELLKEGYFDEHGRLKPEEQLGDFREKLTQVKEYFDE